MRDKIKIGIIGTGFARKVQIPAFKKFPTAEIVSVASKNLENARLTADEFKIPHFTDDWKQTVAREDIDLICITSPPVTHFEIAMQALRAGKNVLCEKPMAMNVSEAKKMLEAARNKKLLALVDHELRFLNGRKKALEMLRRGEIGKIRHAKYSFRAPHRGDVSIPWNWWSDTKSGGGTLGAIGSHAIDSFQWLLGTDISQVFCQLQSHVKERKNEKTGKMQRVTTDDEANLILRFKDSKFVEDATGTISLSMVEYPEYQNRLEIFGTKGAIRIEFDGKLFISDIENEKWKSLKVKLNPAIKGVKNTGWNNGFLNFAGEILNALQNGKSSVKYAATFEDGYKVQKVMDAARISNETGRIIKIR